MSRRRPFPSLADTTVPLDEGQVYLNAVEVVGYLDIDGSERYRLRYDGKASQLVGLLTMAEHDIVAARNRGE